MLIVLKVDVPYFMSIMSRFLLLVVTSIWTRISFSTTVLEPWVSDDTSLAIDTSNPFDPDRSTINSEVASIDAQSNSLANGELTPSYDCFSYNVPSKAKLRARRCDYSNLRTKPQTAPGGETQTPPKSHGGGDPQEPNDSSDEKNSPPSNAEPEEEFDGVLTNVVVKDPWIQCSKYLRGILKYAVCDNPYINPVYQPLPLVYPNAPFWALFSCTLGKLLHRHDFRVIFEPWKWFSDVTDNSIVAQKWYPTQDSDCTPVLIRVAKCGAAGITTLIKTWGLLLAALQSTIFNWPAMFFRMFTRSDIKEMFN